MKLDIPREIVERGIPRDPLHSPICIAIEDQYDQLCAIQGDAVLIYDDDGWSEWALGPALMAETTMFDATGLFRPGVYYLTYRGRHEENRNVV